MTSDCLRIRHNILDSMSGTLPESEGQAIRAHLDSCVDCRRYAEALEQEHALLIDHFSRIDAGVAARQKRVLETVALLRPPRRTNIIAIWRTIMKNSMMKFAVAAVVIMALLLGLHQFGGSAPAFAEIVQPLLAARTVTFRVTINIEGAPPQIRRCMYMEPGHTRDILPSGVIRIQDKRKGQTVDLYPTEKAARIYEMTNVPEHTVASTYWFEQIREAIRQAQKTADESVRFLGKQRIDGTEVLGYRLFDNPDLIDMTVWANAETLLPTSIEYSLTAASTIPNIEGTIIYSDLVFNEELDDSLFSLAVPEGYDSQTVQYDYEPSTKPSEEDLIGALRLWTDGSDGRFPPELTMNAAVAFIQRTQEQMGLEFEKGKTPDLSNPNLYEFYQMRRRILRGITFVRELPAESDWHYTGEDVQLGEAEKVLLRWRLDDGQYRIMFGDLSVRTASAEELTELE